MRRTGLSQRWKFWGVAYTSVVLSAGSNLPTPLYRSYETAFGFTPLMVTLIFAVYVAALIPSLLLIGPLSDAVGRRPVLLAAVLLAAAGSAIFALAAGTWWLFGARILQGVALGAASGALIAALVDLEPTGDRRKAALISTVGTVCGLGAGPLLAGWLAQYASYPLVLPYAVEIVLLVPAAAVILTLPNKQERGRWHPTRPHIPAALRPVFATSGVVSFFAFTVLALFLTLIPSYIATVARSSNLLLGGAAVALMLACSACAQLIGYRRPPHKLETVGLPILAAGLLALTSAGFTSSLLLFVLAISLAGIGQGLAYLGGLTAVNQVAPAHRHAEVLSSFYIIIYLGVGLPVIGVGFLATRIPLTTTVELSAVLIAFACLILLTLTAHRQSKKAPNTKKRSSTTAI
ncbi:MFS transporter [Rathayibacter soli]|uniref:MFS transporter n=1 Tax=Rathayibacter soli TaxID=3144168 RepID=UPI0027E5A998|nr:MFS transporter [Glaciibacter superstes]